MVYRWGDRRSYAVDPNVAGKVMEDLAAKEGLTAQNLVKASRPEDAPLHGCFEWDDRIAADHYRENQARHIITAIEVVRDEGRAEEKEKPVVIQAFHALRTDEVEGYEHIETIMSDEEKKERLMQLAKRDMGIFKDKYSELKRLSKVFSAMDEILEDN